MEKKVYNLATHLSEFRSQVTQLSEKSTQLRRYL